MSLRVLSRRVPVQSYASLAKEDSVLIESLSLYFRCYLEKL